jgi:uncharacterized membrane protein
MLSELQKTQIVNAIKAAELNTSGEVKVHIEQKCPTDTPVERATALFTLLKLTETEQRNGVLFYISLADRKFAVWGDVGINTVVPADFWESVYATVKEHLSQGLLADGLAAGIAMTGEKLKAYFPYQSDDTNELSDEISFGE